MLHCAWARAWVGGASPALGGCDTCSAGVVGFARMSQNLRGPE
jgi:hypothetical protein